MSFFIDCMKLVVVLCIYLFIGSTVAWNEYYGRSIEFHITCCLSETSFRIGVQIIPWKLFIFQKTDFLKKRNQKQKKTIENIFFQRLYCNVLFHKAPIDFSISNRSISIHFSLLGIKCTCIDY